MTAGDIQAIRDDLRDLRAQVDKIKWLLVALAAILGGSDLARTILGL